MSGGCVVESSDVIGALLMNRDSIEALLEESVADFKEAGELGEAIGYAVMGEGKRARPMIVLLVAQALGFDLDIQPAMVAVEYLHTASLIADDLPCMDNDAERRGRPSLHLAYGEQVAILASYGLIAEAFHKITENGDVMGQADTPFAERAHEVTTLALKCATRCAGMKGATLGQFLDLHPKELSLEAIEEILCLKTVTLFEGSFTLGWLFGGGDIERLSDVKQLAYHFGLAFQVRDDILDAQQDGVKANAPNLMLFLGREKAVAYLNHQVQLATKIAEELSLMTAPLAFLLNNLTVV